MNKVKVATICMTSRANPKENMEKAYGFVKRAAEQGASWVLLPEVFAYNGPYERFEELGQREGSELLSQVCGWAKDLEIVIFAGTIGECPDGSLTADQIKSRNGYNRVYNTMWVIGRDGQILEKYRKTHLFNLLNRDGSVLYSEVDGFIPGDLAVTVEVDGFKVGLAICYDLRFAEYFQMLQKNGPCDVFMIPAAFTKKTGEAHWELLLRSRAVEYQAFVIAANQVGESSPGKETFGHSMVVSPWGVVLDNTQAEEGFAFAEVAKDELSEVRGQLPALQNRLPRLYGEEGQ